MSTDAERRVFKSAPSDEGKRLDVFLSEKLHISRSRSQKIIEGAGVFVDGKEAGKSFLLSGQDEVEAVVPADKPAKAIPENIPLNIVLEDDYIIVIDKPPGMVVHPAPGYSSGTLVNALMAHTKGLSSVGGEERPGIVHRLDKGTSGLIMAAKTDEAHQGLSRALKNREIKKTYIALVVGSVKKEEGVIAESIGRHTRDRKKMAAGGSGGRDSVTRWRVLQRYRGFTLVEASPETGRTHQIRVHLAHIGHPIAGDAVYGGDNQASASLGLKRQFLHAAMLKFLHPVTGREISVVADLPEDLKNALDKIGCV